MFDERSKIDGMLTPENEIGSKEGNNPGNGDKENWTETGTSIIFALLLFLTIFLIAKLYGLVKGTLNVYNSLLVHPRDT